MFKSFKTFWSFCDSSDLMPKNYLLLGKGNKKQLLIWECPFLLEDTRRTTQSLRPASIRQASRKVLMSRRAPEWSEGCGDRQQFRGIVTRSSRRKDRFLKDLRREWQQMGGWVVGGGLRHEWTQHYMDLTSSINTRKGFLVANSPIRRVCKQSS